MPKTIPVYELPSLLDTSIRIKVEVDSPIAPLLRAMRAGLSWLMWADVPAEDAEDAADLRNFFIMALSYASDHEPAELVTLYEKMSLSGLADVVSAQGAAFQL